MIYLKVRLRFLIQIHLLIFSSKHRPLWLQKTTMVDGYNAKHLATKTTSHTICLWKDFFFLSYIVSLKCFKIKYRSLSQDMQGGFFNREKQTIESWAVAVWK